MTLMDAPTQTRPTLRMSEEEFATWAMGKRVEWVDGEVVFKMSDNEQQDRLHRLISFVLETIVSRRRLGRVYGPNFTTRLRLPDKVVRRDPDVMFVRAGSASKISSTLIDGPPDLAVEIVSPDSENRDFREKYHEYEQAGVREYWIVSPLSGQIHLFVRDEKANAFAARDPDAEGRYRSTVIEGLWFRSEDLFNAEKRDALAILKQIDPTLLA